MAMAVEEQTTRDGAFIPTNLKVGQFTQFDNLDFPEYTKNGRTLHGSSFQAFTIPNTIPATVISYGPIFPKSPTNYWRTWKQIALLLHGNHSKHFSSQEPSLQL